MPAYTKRRGIINARGAYLMSAHVKRRAGFSHSTLPTPSGCIRLRAQILKAKRAGLDTVPRVQMHLAKHALPPFLSSFLFLPMRASICLYEKPDNGIENFAHGRLVIGTEALLPRGVTVRVRHCPGSSTITCQCR